jgi:hypothetical protein
MTNAPLGSGALREIGKDWLGRPHHTETRLPLQPLRTVNPEPRRPLHFGDRPVTAWGGSPG